MAKCKHDWTYPTYTGTYESARYEPKHTEEVWGGDEVVVSARTVPAHYTHTWRRECKKCGARQRADGFKVKSYPAPTNADWLVRAMWTKTPEKALEGMREDGLTLCWYDLKRVWVPAKDTTCAWEAQ